jgi:chromosome segregation ATPase
MLQLGDTRKEIKKYKDLIKDLFSKSNSKETELKNYISKLNNKISSYLIPYDNNIENMHKHIMSMIEKIQGKIKIEINHTKKEMENEVIGKFQVVEEQQQKIMEEKINEQRRVFDRVTGTRNEIDKIRMNFISTNKEYESLTKENEHQKIVLQSLKEDNQNLSNKIEDVKRNYIKLVKQNGSVLRDEDLDPYNLLSEDDYNSNIYEMNEGIEAVETNNVYDSNVMLHKRKSSITSRSINSGCRSAKNKTMSHFYKDPHDNKIDEIINTLNKSIEDTKIKYNNLNSNYLQEIKRKNEAQQLLQKCIEDLKYEISKVTRDIAMFTKINFGKKGYEELIQAKNKNLSNLEEKLKKLTFIYDNGFQNIRKKNLIIK